MIALTAGQARAFAALLRKTVTAAGPRGPAPFVRARAGPGGTTVTCLRGEVGLRLHAPAAGAGESGDAGFAADLLDHLAEAGSDPIVLDAGEPGRGVATWADAGRPRTVPFTAADPAGLADWPAPVGRPVTLPAAFVGALAAAVAVTPKDGTRYAFQRVVCRGATGEVIATDGTQLLIQGGFRFPWADDRLVPRLPVWGGRWLPAGGPVRVAAAAAWVLVRVGPWEVALRHDPAARYPDVRAVTPPWAGGTRWRIDPADAAALVRDLPRGPAGDADPPAVTLDLDPARPAVRAAAPGGPAEEVRLAAGSVAGPAVRVALDRRHLRRLLVLGLPEVRVGAADRPVIARGRGRALVLMPLAPGAVVPPPAASEPSRPLSPLPPLPPTRRTDMPTPAGEPQPSDDLDPVAEVLALRADLQAALARTARLLAALKEQRRQDRAVKAAVTSLRPLLRHLDP